MNQPAPAPTTALQLGDSGYALLGFGLAINADQVTGDVVISVLAAGGRVSEIVGMRPVQVPVLELARIPAAQVVALLKAKETEEEPAIIAKLGALRPMG